MTDLVTSAQMRAIERSAIESGAVTGLALMERAGEGVVAATLARWPDLRAAPGWAVVLCGPGNNGGDGFVVARLLQRLGWRIDLYLHGDPARLPPDARAMHDLWAALGPVHPLDDPKGGVHGGFGAEGPALIVDALFGTGLTRPLPWAVEQALSDIQHWKERHRRFPPCVAVDVPSGLCADSGRAMGCRLACDLTVTFHAGKTGQVLGEGPDWCGAVEVVDIGLKPGGGGVALVEEGAVRPRLAKRNGHKYQHGHALVLTGGMGRSGAARLAARAALRVGAGLVTLGAPGAAMMECAAQITALMLRRVEDGAALVSLLEDRRINALCLGPGMGVARASEALAALRHGGVEPRPAVVDADALTALGRVETALPQDWVLTPHGGEFARAFPDLAARETGPGWSKVDAARAASARAGCVVLLKGPDTVIAAPDGRAAVHAASGARAAPWLATAGAGDVLAGLIAGLIARGFTPFDAASAAAWLHVEAARAFGPGLIAEDLPEALPGVLKAIL